MEITVEKIAMFRESFNPTNATLNLDIDWSVEYTNTDQRSISYDIILKSEEYLNFKLCGLIHLEELEEFIQQECSEFIFHHACTILLNLFSLTKQTHYELLNGDIQSAVNINATF